MKKLAPLLVALSACIYTFEPVFAESDRHFRSARWYDSIESVKANEKSVFVEQRREKIRIPGRSDAMPVESLYYRDSVAGKPALVRYQFDGDCGQLFQGTYIFEKVLGDREVFRLVSEFEGRYGTKIYIQYPNGILYAVGRVGKETKVRVVKSGGPFAGSKRTSVNALTVNFSRYGGWRKGSEPSCASQRSATES